MILRVHLMHLCSDWLQLVQILQEVELHKYMQLSPAFLPG